MYLRNIERGAQKVGSDKSGRRFCVRDIRGGFIPEAVFHKIWVFTVNLVNEGEGHLECHKLTKANLRIF